MIFTLQDLVDFCFSKLSHDPVNMDNCEINDKCGCILAEYAKSREMTEGGCDYCSVADYKSGRSLDAIEDDQDEIGDLIVEFEGCEIETFGEAQEILKKLGYDSTPSKTPS